MFITSSAYQCKQLFIKKIYIENGEKKLKRSFYTLSEQHFFNEVEEGFIGFSLNVGARASVMFF